MAEGKHKRRYLTTEDREEIMQELAAGADREEVRKKWGIARNTVQKLAKQAGVVRPYERNGDYEGDWEKRKPDRPIEEWREDWDKTCAEIRKRAIWVKDNGRKLAVGKGVDADERGNQQE